MREGISKLGVSSSHLTVAVSLMALVILPSGSGVAGESRLAEPGVKASWYGRAQPAQGESHRGFTIPLGLSIQAMAIVDSQTVIAGSFGSGIFRSEDRGQSWSHSSEGLTDPFVLTMVTDADGTIYAGTFRGGVFRSQDEGKTWNPQNKGLKHLQVKALLVRGGVTYAGTGSGVYRYSQGKGVWKTVTTGLENILVECLGLARDGTLYAGTSGKGLMQYRANASGWRRLSSGLVDHEGLRENYIRVLTVDTDHALYAGTFDGGVYRSSDKGKSWKPISRALPNDSIRGIVKHGSWLVVATGRGIFRTPDEGKEWTAINEGLTELSIQVLVASTGKALYAGTSGGAFRSDNGTTWVSINKGLQGQLRSPFPMR